MRAPPEGLSDAIFEAARAAGLGITVSIVDASGARNIWVNECLIEIFARDEEELLARSAFDFIAPEEVPRLQEQRERRARGDSISPLFETVIISGRGDRIPIAVSLAYVMIRGQRMVVSFVRDIRERKKSEAELRASEARFRGVVEGAPDGVVISRDGIVVFANAAAAQLLGVDPPSALIGRSLAEFLDADGVRNMRERIMRLVRGEKPEPPIEYRATRADGSIVIAEIAALPIDYEGKPAIIAFARDVTERAALQTQLARAERLAAVGTLAAGVAHEINNPLTFVTLGVDALERAIDEGADANKIRGLIHEVRQGSSRVAAIVRELRAFAQSPDDVVGPVDMSAVLAASERLVAHELRGRARIVRHLQRIPRVLGNAGRLEQVFVNLLVNAVQALPENRPENVIEITTRTSVTGAAIIEVQDNGSGMPPSVLARVFDPFFTTKAPGVGTGLGLSICHRIVSQLGGDISIESIQGKGTMVAVTLPAATDAPTTRIAEDSERTAPVRKRVLVIDDEPPLVTTLQRLLERDHSVFGTSDAREGLRRLLEDGPWDLILCDVAMPDLDGVDLFDRATSARPDLRDRFVFMTGGAYTARTREFLEGAQRRCIQKPFRISELEALLR
jgi:PAS domain S-box-containing protein